MSIGQDLIEKCKQHILAVMAKTSDCAPTAPGLGNQEISRLCDMDLKLPKQNGWFVWSLLMRMGIDEQIDIIYTKRGKRFRRRRAEE